MRLFGTCGSAKDEARPALAFIQRAFPSLLPGFTGLALTGLAVLGLVGIAGSAQAAVPQPWQLGFQEPATPVMEQLVRLHDYLLILIIAITLFVMALMAYAILRFSAKRNPVPSRTTHNTTIEILWTVIPVVIVIAILIPSFRLLYFQDRTTAPDMTLIVTGNEWYWTYEYPDHGGIVFDSMMIPDDEIQPGQHRLLEVDNRVVVPVNANVRVLVTGNAVIHAWAVPAFGVKKDAIPGRMNETWFRAERTGVFYGQCSELCGIYHGFMPIAVEVVTQEAFEAWVAEARERFASTMPEAPDRIEMSMANAGDAGAMALTRAEPDSLPAR